MTRMSRKTPVGGSNSMRTSSIWLLWTALVCGMATFIVSDRFYHSLEVSQLLVVSIDTVNVGMPQPMVNELPRHQLTSQKSLVVEAITAAIPEHEDPQKEADSPEQQLQQLAQEEASKPMLQHESTTGPKQQWTEPESSPRDTKLRSTVTRVLESDSQDAGGAVHTVYFLNETQVTQQDSFSASWIMTKKDFLEMPLEPVKTFEDAAFKAWNWRRHKLRMTMDYLDFRYVCYKGSFSTFEIVVSKCTPNLLINSFFLLTQICFVGWMWALVYYSYLWCVLGVHLSMIVWNI
jgi:hypothetical protein